MSISPTIFIFIVDMIDSAILTILPPIIASILAFIIADKRAKIQYTNTIASIQYKAIEVMAEAEEKMRDEMRLELNRIRDENERLREEIRSLGNKLENSESLVISLRAEIASLKSLLDNYKEQLKNTLMQNSKDS